MQQYPHAVWFIEGKVMLTLNSFQWHSNKFTVQHFPLKRWDYILFYSHARTFLQTAITSLEISWEGDYVTKLQNANPISCRQFGWYGGLVISRLGGVLVHSYCQSTLLPHFWTVFFVVLRVFATSTVVLKSTSQPHLISQTFSRNTWVTVSWRRLWHQIKLICKK